MIHYFVYTGKRMTWQEFVIYKVKETLAALKMTLPYKAVVV